MKRYLLFTLVLICMSCADNAIVFHEFEKNFTQNRWQKSQVKTYIFENKSARVTDIYVKFSHVYDYQFSEIPMVLTIFFPDGTSESKEFSLVIKDKKGKELGGCLGDYCDLEQKIFANISVPKGTCKMELKHLFSHDYVPNVIGLGVAVKKIN